jgi:hypothetical protein
MGRAVLVTSPLAVLGVCPEEYSADDDAGLTRRKTAGPPGNEAVAVTTTGPPAPGGR